MQKNSSFDLVLSVSLESSISLRDQVQRRSCLCHLFSSPVPSTILFDIVWKAAGGAEITDIEQTEKMVPLITCEIPFGQYVCELMFGVDALGAAS